MKMSAYSPWNSLALWLALTSATAVADELAAGGDSASAPVTWHGFVAQGAMFTDGNGYVRDDNGWSLANTEIGSNWVWQASSDWRLAAQLIYLNGGNRYPEGLRVDYLLADYAALADEDANVHVQFGRFKNSHGLYRDSRDVPATQPSIILPQSVYWDMYRDQTLNTDGISGLGYQALDWGYLDWQLSAGRTSSTDSNMPWSTWVLGKDAKGDYTEKWVVQGSLFLTSPDLRWTGGVSLLRSHLDFRADPGSAVGDGGARVWEGIASLRYAGDRLEVTAEYIYDYFEMTGLLYPQFYAINRSDGFYVQGRYWFSPRWAALARFDYRCLDLNDRSGSDFEQLTTLPSHLRYARDVTLGVSYEPHPGWMLRAEWHRVAGTAWLPPHIVQDAQLHNEKLWDLVAFQLSYQF